MNIDWACPFSLVTPIGTLPINVAQGDGTIYRLNPKNCVGRRSIRATTDNIPQGDGEIFHERYATGSEMQLAIQLWDGGTIACDEVLVDMYDDLRGFLWSLLRPEEDGGRLIWTPAGKDARMLDAARLLSLNDPAEDAETGATEITCVIDSPFPYAIAFTQDTTNIPNTSTVNVPNDGNVEFWPVIKVYASGSSLGAFTLEGDTGLKIEWDAFYGGVNIGDGEYAEIDTFKGTIFLNGNEDDLSGSLVATTSDFFPIPPFGGMGVNAIGSGGFDHAEFLTNDAWA
jgi:Phage tail protein